MIGLIFGCVGNGQDIGDVTLAGILETMGNETDMCEMRLSRLQSDRIRGLSRNVGAESEIVTIVKIKSIIIPIAW